MSGDTISIGDRDTYLSDLKALRTTQTERASAIAAGFTQLSTDTDTAAANVGGHGSGQPVTSLGYSAAIDTLRSATGKVQRQAATADATLTGAINQLQAVYDGDTTPDEAGASAVARI